MCEMCVWRCGLLAKVEDGRVVKLEGNPEHPHSNGNLCPRGQSGLMNTYDPDRVLTPLIRVGKRGEGKFRKASWEEALDLVASNMLEIKQKYGPEAMVFSSTHNLSQVQFENLLYAFGSPNYGTQRSLCFNAMIVANLMTYGMEEPARNYDDLKYIILTGRNLMEAISTSETPALSQAIDRGAKVVYLDPRFTKTAAKATEWLPIKPGTDLAFHLALLNVIITEELYNHEFVKQYTVGFDELAASISQYTPEWAAPITGIPAETIRRIAREFAAAGTVCPGAQRLAHIQFRQLLPDRTRHHHPECPGRQLGHDHVPGRRGGKRQRWALLRSRPTRAFLPCAWTACRGSIRLCRSRSASSRNCAKQSLSGTPYQAHGWFISRQNPVMSLPDRGKTLEAFGKMDFIATVDIIMNDTSWFSDVVLPEASYLERYDPLNACRR